MNIDLKARMRNKAFWVALVSAVVLLIQQLGFKNLIPSNYADIVNSILSILVMLGIVVDPSTNGICDAIKEPIEPNTEVENSNDKSIDTATQNTVQASNDSTASSKITVDNPDNVQAIGQEVNHISASMPQ